MKRHVLIAFVSLSAIMILSCGDGNICIAVITTSPLTATVDSAAMPPANSATFFATNALQGANCPLTPVAIGNVNATWSSSDTTHVSIVSQKTQIGTNGVATCLSPTPSPATITATTPDGKKSTATLICQ